MSEYYENLTPREKEIYCRIINNIEGKKINDLAVDAKISPHTMRTHILNIFGKLGVSSQIELIIKHYKERL